MKNVQISRLSHSGRFVMALATLLLISSASMLAQNKDKPAPKPAPAPAPKSAPAQASHAAPATHSAPAASHPAGGLSSAPANSGRTSVPSSSGRAAVPNTPARSTLPNGAARGGMPSNTGHTSLPNNTGGRGSTVGEGGRSGMPGGRNTGGMTNSAGHGNLPGNSGRGAAPGTPGRSFGSPRPEFHGASGTSARFGTGGRPTVVRTSGGATIVHSPGGGRRIEVVRPGGRVVVTNAAGHGYMQRSFNVRGQAFAQRTYYSHGVAYARYYRPSYYRGVAFNVYTPVRFYSPRFYAWGYSPWGAPVYYNFGFAASPWSGFYAGYFSPYPSYVGPNYWLTDYLLANSMQEAYQEHLDAMAGAQGGYDPAGQTPLSPQVKNMIAVEVQRQLAQESQESQNVARNALPAGDAAPSFLADNNAHVFVVSNSLMANAGGQECALTHGDVLQMNLAPAADPSFANVQVLASKSQDCRAGNIVPVQLVELQEMQNHMRETLDTGLGELQAKQGQSGLPAIDAGMRAQTAAPYAADLPPAETNVADELRQQSQEADRQEQDVLRQAEPPAASSASAGPVTIQIGQTIDEVVARMGRPTRIADLGQKKTYFYKDMKVIFIDGRVSDVE